MPSRIGVLKRIEKVYDGFATESAVTSTSVGHFTSSIYAPSGEPPATEAFVTIESAPISYCYNGSNPSATSGHIQPKDTSFIIEGLNNIENFGWTSATGLNGKIKVTYDR